MNLLNAHALKIGDHVRIRSGSEAVIIGIDGDNAWCRYVDDEDQHTTQKLEWLERWRSKAWHQIEDERRARAQYGLEGIVRQMVSDTRELYADAKPIGNYSGT